MSYIYLVTNKINGKQYVGQHKYDGVGLDKRYIGSGVLLHKAYDRYGIENFTMELLEECSDEDLNPLEQLYIEHYNTLKPNGYNLTKGGDGVYGFTFSPESIEKLSLSHKGKRLSPETIEKMRQSRIGHITSDETKQKISNALTGRKFSEERCKNISNALLGNTPWNKGKIGVISDETKQKLSESHINHTGLSKGVYQYKKDGTFITYYPSASEAYRTVGVNKHHITECCNNKRKSAGGYLWSYEMKKAA